MTSFDTLQSISSRLKELSTKLSTSKLSKEELEEFEILSRKLYERAIILSYKAKEESVYGKLSQEKTAVVEDTVEISVEEETTEVKVDKLEKTPEKIEEKSGEIQFDFSGGFDTVNNETIPQSEQKISAEVEKPIEENLSEETPVKSSQEDILSNAEESNGVSEKTLFFYERFSKAYKISAGDKLGTSKIDSLKGAIGLNDRLQFISELFGGDSAAYNSTIDLLDQLENNEVALRKLSEIATQENWNKDVSAVDEFAHFINRRYVD